MITSAKKSIILLLDREHLEQPFFMKLFAQKLGDFRSHRLILVHSDSAYTQRLIENGTEPQKAKERAIKEINQKLVALLAEYGMPAVGLHGFHRNTITQSADNELHLNPSVFNLHPHAVVLVVSNLVLNETTQEVTVANLAKLAIAIKKNVEIDEIWSFALSEQISFSFIKTPPTYSDCLNMATDEALSGKGEIKMLPIADFEQEKAFLSAVVV